MPRNRQRFKRLKELLKDSKGAPAAGSDADGYLRFISGQSIYKISSTALSEIKAAGGRSSSYGVALIPFNRIPSPADAKYSGAFTKYSKSIATPINGLLTEAGHSAITDDGKTLHDSQYYPALCRLFVRDAGDPVDKTSQITGNSYKRIAGNGATVPFGCKAASGELEDVRKSSVLSQATKNGAYTASYVPEEWNAGKSPRKPV